MRGWKAPGIALLVAAVAVAALAPIGAAARAPGTGAWPMFADGAAHNAVNRAETTLTPSNVSGLHVTHTYPGWTEIQADTVYQVIVGSFGYSVTSGTRGGANTYITAFHLPSGSRAWRHQISSHNQTWNYVPAVVNGVLFVGGKSAMFAFNATTGQALWTTSVSAIGWFNEVTVTNGVVYADTYQGQTVYAFNATTGHQMWSVIPPGCCLTGAVTVSGSLAYVELSGDLIAYNATTGAHVFTATAVGGGGDTVAVSGGVAFVQTANDLQAFNAATGTSLWSAATEAGNVVSSLTPAVDGSTVVVGTTRYLIAFSASTGHRLWTYDAGSDYAEFLPPAIANGVVYAGSGGNGTPGLQRDHRCRALQRQRRILLERRGVERSRVCALHRRGDRLGPLTAGAIRSGLHAETPVELGARVSRARPCRRRVTSAVSGDEASRSNSMHVVKCVLQNRTRRWAHANSASVELQGGVSHGRGRPGSIGRLDRVGCALVIGRRSWRVGRLAACRHRSPPDQDRESVRSGLHQHGLQRRPADAVEH